MRLISWNIRAGGGVRADAIAAQIKRWQPDLIALSEFRDTPPSRSIATALQDAGLHYQRKSVNKVLPATNALLVASRWPLRQISLQHAPAEKHRWLQVNVAAPSPFSVLALHIPNRSSGRKYPFMHSVTQVVEQWRGKPAILMGDTNSGRIDTDEESPAFNRTEDQWLQHLETLNWRDAFRLLHADKPEYTWYSPNGRNGFRLDQIFLHPALTGRALRFEHVWGGPGKGKQEQLSDHAALILDMTD